MGYYQLVKTTRFKRQSNLPKFTQCKHLFGQKRIGKFRSIIKT